VILPVDLSHMADTPSSGSKDKGKGKKGFKVNEVDLTDHLPVPLYYTFTDDQKKMFAEFRKASKKCKDSHTDYYIGRFLIARKWKLKDSVELFDNALKWREEQGIDDIIESFPEDYWYKTLMDYWPNSVNPTQYHWTKDKCPVTYERIGLVNPKMTDIIPRETLFRHHIYCVELMEEENHKIAKANNFAPGNILIEDLEDLGASHLYGKVTALIQAIAQSDEQRYPESVRKVYIVNPPGVFNMVWAIMKPFIEEQTLQKFAFGSPKDFAAEWDDIIGKDNLPKYLGGTLEWDPQPGGNSVAKLLPSDLHKLSISKKADHIIEADVKKGQTFHWQVMCKKDIGIGLFVKTGSSSKDRKPVDKWPVKKYDGDNSPHHGSYTVSEDCTLICYLDNTDSFMLHRKIKYFTYTKSPVERKKK